MSNLIKKMLRANATAGRQTVGSKRTYDMGTWKNPGAIGAGSEATPGRGTAVHVLRPGEKR